MVGFVKKVVPEKNFGFIRSVDGGIEYFFHRDDFGGNWDELVQFYYTGSPIEVQFIEVDSMKGPRAGSVRYSDN